MFDLHTRRFAPTPLHPTELEQKSARESLRSWAFLPSVRRKPEWELSSGRRKRTPTLVIVSDSPIAGQSKIEWPQVSTDCLYVAGAGKRRDARHSLDSCSSWRSRRPTSSRVLLPPCAPPRRRPAS